MSDLVRAAVGLFAAVAPLGALPAFLAVARRDGAAPPLRLASFTSAFSLGALTVMSLVADPLLEWLEVSPESFQFAAGAVMAPFAARLLLTGTSMPTPSPVQPAHRLDWLFPLGIPLTAGPAAIVAAICYAARFGTTTAIAASIVAVTATLLILAGADRIERHLRPVGVNALGRLSGALLAVIAVELAVNGVKSV